MKINNLYIHSHDCEGQKRSNQVTTSKYTEYFETYGRNVEKEISHSCADVLEQIFKLPKRSSNERRDTFY